MQATTVLTTCLSVVAGTVGFYCVFVCLLAIPAVQDQVIYLNKVKLTWFQDVNQPEQWGFLHNQVTPFHIPTRDGETLHAWHILPFELYRRHEEQLVQELAGLVADVTERLSFRLLRDDPDALLVLYFHGAAGTLGSGFRPPSYRAIAAGAPGRIHIVAIDYRGFGTSSGQPSEAGLLTDALSLMDWAVKVAGIPPGRIVLFAQSLGTAVCTSLMHHLAVVEAEAEAEPVLFRGAVLVAPFADVAQLTTTYRVAGTLPLLEPVALCVPWLLTQLHSLIHTKWPTARKLGEFVRSCESLPDERPHYHITLLHAQDDYDVPWTHTETIYWHAVNASLPLGITYEALETDKARARTELGAGGWRITRQTRRGVLTEHILLHGLHDRIMGYPAVSLAISQAFGL